MILFSTYPLGWLLKISSFCKSPALVTNSHTHHFDGTVIIFNKQNSAIATETVKYKNNVNMEVNVFFTKNVVFTKNIEGLRHWLSTNW